MTFRLAVLLYAASALCHPTAIAAEKVLGGPAGKARGDCTAEEEILVNTREGTYVLSTGKCGKNHQAWLSVVSKGDGGSVEVDRLTMRPLAATETFSAGPYCYKGKTSIQWVAIYEWNKRKKMTSANGGIKSAWVINTASRSFQPAPKDLIDAAVCFADEGE